MAWVVVFALLASLASATCAGPGGGSLFKEYEYEEEVYLDLDGSATVFVNGSIPALVALHGLDLDPGPRARVDRTKIRELFEVPGVDVTRVSRPWRRGGRPFVQIRLEVADIHALSSSPPFARVDYRLIREGDQYVYRQRVTGAERRAVREVGWSGTELVAVRLHLPSRINYHNAPSRVVERGNIVAWEQSLAERRAGAPLDIEVRMDTASILYTTLWLFGLAFLAALTVLAGLVVWVVRKAPARTVARQAPGAAGSSGSPPGARV